MIDREAYTAAMRLSCVFASAEIRIAELAPLVATIQRNGFGFGEALSALPPEFERLPAQIDRNMLRGGVNLPWNLALCMLVGIWLMFTRLTLGAEGAMANADHLIGALVITVSAIACAEVARPARFLNLVFGAALLVTPFVFEAHAAQAIVSWLCAVALIALSLPRGALFARYPA